MTRELVTRDIAVVLTNYLDDVRDPDKRHESQYDDLDYAQADAIYQAVIEPLLKKARNKHYCGCAWCCASTKPEDRGEAHRICSGP